MANPTDMVHQVDTTGISGVHPLEQVNTVADLEAQQAATPTEAEEETTEDEDRPGGNASEEEWYAYRLAHGYEEEELEDLGRNDLRDLDDR